MVRLSLAGNFKDAREIHYRLIDFTNALFLDGSPAGIKAALHKKEFCENILRLPLVPVIKEVRNQIENLMEKLEK